MSVEPDTRAERRFSWWILALTMAAVAAILALTPGALNLAAFGQIKLRAPDLAPLLAQAPLVQFHVATIVIALALGPVQFALPKGTRAHRVTGWIWVSAMFSTAIATLFIRDMNGGQFSPIHLFSLMSIVGVPMAVLAARHGRVAAHTRAMIGLYIGLIIAGVTAIAPGRLVWDVFFS